ncbi:sodium/iodide cotransporter, putative [Pediculus humanus corporis]|uniref:Sodium/iodide cotransporter, putative n=1 Tax=Pediculus humanus subsp. corporis TaxID=121224 RepID=E0VS34_PEDHC|nr:sodium/iodide cotransporter, putative [Pediculus humanus corporis]EEB16190.1 sodium/iodide cotransporter, putative [Pediculus humanus corporis]
MEKKLTSSDDEIRKYFGWEDYTVFGGMLLVSAGIGVYHGFSFKKKKNDVDSVENGSAKEFLTASGKMSTLPVALSMLASFLSSITLMGQPAEVYLYGPGLWLIGIAFLPILPVLIFLCVPFFRNLNVTSAYEYFGQRFGRPFQCFASVSFTLQILLFLALVLYAPALALHQVTGINTLLVVVIMYFVCIFYTTIGGMKAVAWTDTFQIIVLYTAVIAVVIKGTLDLGGFEIVWKRNLQNSRGILFDFNIDPTERYTFWSSFVGGAFLHLSVFGANQMQIQRYLTVPTMKSVKNMLYINGVGWTIVTILTAYSGMLIYAKYYDCDPISNKDIKTPDQLFPFYVMDVLGEYKGFPGLFVAGIFSAGLSTVSTGVNSLAAIWFSELEGTKFKKNLDPKKAGLVVKGMALFFGLSSFVLVFLVPYMGNLVPVTISLSSFFSGSFFGIFVLGNFVPFANSWGAFSGLTCGIGFVGWLAIGTQISLENGYKINDVLPTSVENCYSNNITSSIFSEKNDREPAFALYRLSFLWYSLLALVITVTVGVIVSGLTNLRYRSLFKTNSYQEVSKIEKVDGGKPKNLGIYVAKGRELDVKLLTLK